MKNYVLCLVVSFLCVCRPVCAQKIEHFGVEEGLGGIQTFSITQDKTGFIWIATRFGVNRLDGKNIKNYPIPVISNGQSPIRLTHVLLDRDSTLWCYTDRGAIYKYNNNRDEFVCNNDLELYLRHVFFDENNDLWVGTRSFFGILKKDSLHVINTNELKNNEFKQFHPFDSSGFLVVANHTVYHFDIRSEKLICLLTNERLAGKPSFESIYYDRNENKIWIGCAGQGLFLYEISSGRCEPVENRELLYQPLLVIRELNAQYLLLGTDGKGLCLLDRIEKKIVRMYNYHSPKEMRIKGNGVYDIYRDKSGKVWISTFSDGVYVFDFKKQDFHVIRHEENNDNSLLHNVVCDILCDSNNNLWFATNYGISHWNRKNNRWTTSLLSKNVLCLFEDSKGKIWAGTYSSGVFVLDKQGNILQNYINRYGRDDELGTNFVYTINEDSEGNIWTGGKKGKVSKLDIHSNRFTQFAVTQANYILVAPNDVICVAAESGIFKLVKERGEYIQYRFSSNMKSTFINDMYLESDSIIWLATYGDGLNRYNLETRQVRSFTTKEGLASNFIYAILRDGNDLWMSSENGLIRFDIQLFTVTNFSQFDGLSSNKFRQLSRRESSDGTLYFGSYDGLTYFKPKEVTEEKTEAKLYFEHFFLFNKIVKANDEDSPLTTSIENTSHIRLNYKQHSFSIQFTTIDFSEKNDRKYSWQLEGLDENWMTPTSENTANYTNLQPGKYTFILRNIDDNHQTIDERRIAIEVVPPFWKTAWAQLIFLCLLMISAYLVWRYAKQRLERKNAEEKMQFFIHTAHDIRTPLTLISAPVYQLKDEIPNPSPRTHYLLDLISGNLKKLNDTFSQLLDFQKAYEYKDQLMIREHNINQYFTKKIKQWEPAAAKKNIHLQLLELPENRTEWFDGDKMDKIIDNLLSNAVKYTPENGTVAMELTSDEKRWSVKISDSGIGIAKKDLKKLFSRFFRGENAINTKAAGSGLGLILVKRYVDLHQGTIRTVSAENKGTTFYLTFLHGKKQFAPFLENDEPENAQFLESESEPEPEKSTQKIKVLIVEDNDDLRLFLKTTYEPFYQIFTAQNGAEAWENIPKINPDMIVSDMQMPQMDGLQLVQKIKNTFETSHIPVILLTVVNDRASVEKAFELGVDDYIEKPFETKYLQMKMNNIIRNRKILRSKFLGIDKTLEDNTHTNELNRQFIEKASSIIDEHIADSQFSIADFSKEMGLSKSLLYTKFNTITGYTPNDFIKIARMKKAVEYFRQKQYSINEVTYRVGFEDPAYFSNCFKKIYGDSPKTFIEKNL